MNDWKSLEEVVFLAEESPEPPSLPEGGLPRQKVPGWIRWPIRLLMTPFVILDLAAQRFVRLFFKTPYKKEGKCSQRGNCCRYILFPVPNNFLGKLYYFWNTEINGFFPRSPQAFEIDDEQYIVMGCRYFQPDGRCGHYRLRPTICRTWPQIEYFGRPRILKGCGFKAVPRNPNFDPFPQEESTPKRAHKLNVLKDG